MAVKNFKLMSFGDEAEEEEELNAQASTKVGRSPGARCHAHPCVTQPSVLIFPFGGQRPAGPKWEKQPRLDQERP